MFSSKSRRAFLATVFVGAFLIFSIALNVRFVTHKPARFLTETNANSRPTYFTMHRIGEAQRYATGRGVRIGIIDHYFGFGAHRALYAGGADFLGDSKSFQDIAEHGFWLATTAKEIAPQAEIYALNATTQDEPRKVVAMVKAIQWAVAQKIDILTYSERAFSPDLRPQIDAAVDAAVAAGVTCVFVHYTNPQNLLPFPMLPPDAEPKYDRPGDVNVLHYDYNLLDVAEYQRAQREKRPSPRLFLSISSTSVVTAGIVAMMRELDPALTPAQCKEVLIRTSRPYEATSSTAPEIIRSCAHVVDALAAVTEVRGSVEAKAAASRPRSGNPREVTSP